MSDSSPSPVTAQPGLVRQLGLFHATMIVMGGIVGSGIFMNPAVVAQKVHTPLLILGAWAIGGVVALLGAFVYAELGALRPQAGGQYAYIREAYHPSIAFVYGWTLLLVIQTGGMAAVAVTLARYLLELTRAPLPDWLVATVILGTLTAINCFGAKAGSAVQSGLMVLKILTIAMLVVCGLMLVGPVASGLDAPPQSPLPAQGAAPGLLVAMGAAMVPVLFSYGGWQTANFIAGEVKDPQKTMPRALLAGVIGVVILYLAVNYICVRVLGASGLAATSAPASDVMRAALGDAGARLIAAGIAISGLGFLSQSMLTAPRVYYAMAADGSFFKSVAWVHPRTHAPVLAIALQGLFAIVIATTKNYEQILDYVVSADFLFFGLTATCIFILRRREKSGGQVAAGFRVPGHPFTTLLFVTVSWLVAVNTIVTNPGNTLIGMAIMCAGFPAYLLFRARATR